MFQTAIQQIPKKKKNNLENMPKNFFEKTDFDGHFMKKLSNRTENGKFENSNPDLSKLKRKKKFIRMFYGKQHSFTVFELTFFYFSIHFFFKQSLSISIINKTTD